MPHLRFTAGLFCFGLMGGNVFAQNIVSTPVMENHARLPLAFEKHAGGSGERFVARGQGYVIDLDAGKATIRVTSSLSLEFAGASPSHAVVGDELPGKVNYIRGNDPRRWQLGVPTYARVAYPDTYPGIDVVYYGNQQQLEFDLLVKPGADPEAIRLKIAGAAKLSIDASGTLDAGDVTIALPRIYQEVNGVKKSVAGRYAIVGRDEVAFKVAPWDRTRTLVIDPTLAYSALFGGSQAYNYGRAIGIDSSGNILIAGFTGAVDFPTVDAAQNGLDGNQDAFVSKINPTGTALVYSTYLGGSSYDDAYGLAVDSTNSVWITGMTGSSDFPVLNAAQSVFGGATDAFVAKLNAAGVLQFSTFLGAAAGESANAIAVDGNNNGYITGYTYGTFPTTAGALAAGGTFVAKYGPGGALLYSALLPVSTGLGIAVDSAGAAYVTGSTDSGPFTGMPAGGAQTTNNGNGDAFVAKLDPSGASLTYFTYLGGTGFDQGTAIAVDAMGDAYVAGQTNSTGLATGGAAQQALAGGYDGFAAELNPSGSKFTYITYLGGIRQDYLMGLALDGNGNVYLTGYTDSNDFPTVAPIQAPLPGVGTSLYRSVDSGASLAAFDLNIPGAVVGISLNAAAGTAVALTEAGIYRTTNGGTSWIQQFAATFSGTATYFARSPVAPSTIYASAYYNSFYQSTDDGVTWTSAGPLPSEAGGILADPLTAGTVYFFCNRSPSVYISKDSGSTFTAISTGLPSAQVGAMTATADGAIYAGVSGFGIYKSTNQGGLWTAVNTGLPASALVFPLSLTSSGSTIYFVALGSIYKTTNGGAGWAATPTSVNAAVVAPSPQNAAVLYAFTSGGAIVESSDGGTTWSVPATGLPQGISFSPLELLVDPANSAHVFLVAPVNQAGFAAKLNNTGSALTWSTYLGGNNFTYAYAVATDGAGDAFVTGFTNGAGFPVTSTALPSGIYATFVTKISDATAACTTLSVSPGSLLISEYGQTVSFSVAAPSGCAWMASTDQPWAVIESAASGTGDGIVIVQFAANSGNSTRSATLTAGSQNVTINQPAGFCSYSFDQTSYPIVAGGGTVSAILTATAGCPWIVTNNDSTAISVTSNASGTGSATIGITVSPNLRGNPLNFYLPVGTTQIQIAQAGVGVVPQTITFDAIPNQILGLSPFEIAAKTSSGLPVGVASTTTAVCRTVGGLVVLLAAGTCSITVSQPGNVTFGPAASVTQSFTVIQAKVSGSFTLAAGSPFAVGASPQSVAVGDFNGDGIPDLATANESSNNLTVLLGQASGGFIEASGSPFTVGAGPVTVIVGDFNVDGKTDLAVTSSLENTVTVLLGDGKGGFTVASGSPIGGVSNPRAMALGDFNGDGIQDLAITSMSANTVTVLLGNGSGSFGTAPGSPFTVGLSPVSVAVGDFNGDGIQDLATANSSGNNVTVLLGSGSGGFTAAPGSPFTVGTEPVSVAVGDFNGDGVQDLAAASLDGNLTVLLGSVSGGFTAAPGSPFTAGAFPESVVVGDFNGDGIQDLATANSASNNVSVLLGSGKGGFTAAAFSPIAVGSGPMSIAVGDFNGDGIEDLATANSRSGSVTVLPGLMVGSTPQSITFGTLGQVSYGIPPFTIGATASSGLTVSFASAIPSVCTVAGTTVTIVGGGICSVVASQAGNATFAAAATVTQSFGVNPIGQTISFGPMSNQALGSLPPPLGATASSGLGVTYVSNSTAVCTVSGVTITLLTVGMCSITASQQGNSGYTGAPPVTQTFQVAVATAQTITFDAIPNQIFGISPFVIAAQAGSLLPVGFVSSTPAVCKTASVLVELLSAGTCSITASQPGNATYSAATAVTRNFNVSVAKLSGSFMAAAGSPFAVANPRAVAVGDFNGDSVPDLAYADVSLIGTNTVTVLLGNGSGGFAPSMGSPFVVGGVMSIADAVAVGDFNGDGFQDLAVANQMSGNVTLLLGDGSGGFTPVPGSPFSVGQGPYSIVVGDFNGDGIQDLATANYFSGNVTVLLGNGSGGFNEAPGSPFAAGKGAVSTAYLAVGDFNRDGIQDLAVAVQGNNSIVVFLGEGSGGFTAAVGSPFAVGDYPGSLVVADFNGDGIPDLATANSDSNDVTVLLGDGSGGFAAAVGSPFAVGTYPGSLVVGDFNGDGIPDLATANSASNDVSVMLGKGSGGFSVAAGSPMAVGTGSYLLAVGDFNGDGIEDLAAAGSGSGNNVMVLLGLVVGTTSQTIAFGSPSNVTYGVSPFTLYATSSSNLVVSFASTTPAVCTVVGTTVTIAGGGTCTIIASQPGNATYAAAATVMQSFKVNSASQMINFSPLSNQRIGTAPLLLGTTASSGLAVSFTSNTIPVCTVSGNTVTLVAVGFCSITARQPGNANYSAAAPVTRSFDVTAAVSLSGALVPASGSPIKVGSEPSFAAAGDFNGDGIPDIVVTDFSANNVTVLLGDGMGGFTAAPGSPFAAGTGISSVAVGDFDGNGVQDLAVSNFNDSTITVMLGNGSGGFAAAPGSPVAAGAEPLSVTVGDFNGDGVEDLAWVNESGNQLTVMLGNGSGGFTAAANSPFAVGELPVSVAVGDFNGDRIQDLAVSNAISGNITVLLGDGTGGFSPTSGSPFAATTGGAPGSIAVGDFNGDGVEDLAVVVGGAIAALLGNGSGGFAAALGSPFAIGTPSFSVVVGDFNGDGIQDLAAANVGSNNVTVLLGNGSGSFTPAAGGPFTADTGSRYVVVGDFNRDGKLDLATANLDGNDVSVLLGALASTGSVLSTTVPLTILAGTAVPLTLAVSDTVTAFGAPTGTVTFLDGTTPLGAAGQTASPYTFTASSLAVGSHTLTATYGGDRRSAGSTSNTVTIQVQLPQTIAFGALATQIVGNPPFTLNAPASSGLTVAFASNSTGVCTVSGSMVTLVAAGTCSITATQPGNSTYAPAEPVTVTFPVDPAFADTAGDTAAENQAIDLMATYGITSGCSTTPFDYCPDETVTRAQMAVFIIRSIYGSNNFPYTATPYFADVPANAQFFKYIQKMKDLGITTGETATTYGPNDTVTRGEMAVFIIRARYGTGAAFNYTPTAYFTDVPVGAQFFQYIQKMKDVGITSGETATTYGPNDPVTRGQMAVFVMRGSFNLLLPATAPAISSVSPFTGTAGTTVNVTVTGKNTSFAQGTTVVTARPGITVQNVTVNSATSLTAQLVIAGNATLGPESLVVTTVVTTGSEEAVAPNGFTITSDPAVGVVAYFTGNNTTVDSVSGVSGTLVNGATYAPATSRTQGLPDAEAFSLNGTNSYVQAASGETATVSGARTLVAWVYPNAATGLGMPILTGGTTSPAADIFGISGTTGICSAGGQYQLYIDHAGTCYVSDISLTPNTWSLVAVTFDGANAVFYINGVASVLTPAQMFSYGLSTYEIGGNTLGGGSSGGSFNGLLSEVQLYGRALTPAEIQGLYAP